MGRTATYNHPTRARTIVKVQRTADNRVLIYGAGRCGMQYRPSHAVRGEILSALDRTKKPVFAFATTDHDGRWHLENVAPDQKW